MSPAWTAAFVALWAVVAALVVLMMGFLRQLGLIQLRLGIEPGVLITEQGLARGEKAPEFAASEVGTKRRVSLGDYRGRRLALVFLSTSCVACRKLVPHLNSVAHDSRQETEFLVVCNSAEEACLDFVKVLGLNVTMLADPTNAIAASYKTQLAPFVFLIDKDGTILIRGVANTWPQLESLLREEGTIQTRQQTVFEPAGLRGPSPDRSDHWEATERVLVPNGQLNEGANRED